MSEAQENRIERVCVALDGVFSGNEVLALAANLAEELDAELAALFIEDVNVLRAAALSFTRELGAASGISTPMRVGATERALRAQGHTLRSALAQTAEQLQLRWSFTIVRGTGLTPVLDQASKTSLTVFAPRTIAPVPRLHARGFSRARPGRQGRCVAVVYDDSADAPAVVRIAALIARSRSASLAPIVVASGPREARELRRRIQGSTGGEIDVLSPVCIEGVSPENTAAAARSVGAELLVAPLGVIGSENLALVLERVSCPLVLVS